MFSNKPIKDVFVLVNIHPHMNPPEEAFVMQNRKRWCLGAGGCRPRPRLFHLTLLSCKLGRAHPRQPQSGGTTNHKPLREPCPQAVQTCPQAVAGQPCPQANAGQPCPQAVARQTCPEAIAGQPCPQAVARQTCPQAVAGQPCPQANAGQPCAQAVAGPRGSHGCVGIAAAAAQ